MQEMPVEDGEGVTHMHPAVEKALNEIDAAVFSGDILYVADDRAELERYVERWKRALGVPWAVDDEEEEV